MSATEQTQYDFVKDPTLLSNINSLLARLHDLSTPNEPDTGEPQIQQARAPDIVLTKHLLSVVQQMKDQVDCVSKRLEGELKDWRTPPVQDFGAGRELKHALEDILTNLYNNNTEHIKLVPLGKIRVKLMGLQNNPYLQRSYRAVAKNMTKADHDYTIAEFPFVASWAPAIALFHAQHPTQQ
jgi:hypothetical protein